MERHDTGVLRRPLPCLKGSPPEAPAPIPKPKHPPANQNQNGSGRGRGRYAEGNPEAGRRVRNCARKRFVQKLLIHHNISNLRGIERRTECFSTEKPKEARAGDLLRATASKRVDGIPLRVTVKGFLRGIEFFCHPRLRTGIQFFKLYFNPSVEADFGFPLPRE